jgi:hypothetical protein
MNRELLVWRRGTLAPTGKSRAWTAVQCLRKKASRAGQGIRAAAPCEEQDSENPNPPAASNLESNEGTTKVAARLGKSQDRAALHEKLKSPAAPNPSSKSEPAHGCVVAGGRRETRSETRLRRRIKAENKRRGGNRWRRTSGQRKT